MFGKGLYFADMSSKSANYCYPTPNKNTGLVLLSEVSIVKSVFQYVIAFYFRYLLVNAMNYFMQIIMHIDYQKVSQVL